MIEKIRTILGTRPEIIKMSPVVRACEDQGADWFMIHTGEHYSYNLDRVFFEQLELPEAGNNPAVGSGRQGSKPGGWLQESRRFLSEEKPMR